jgi:PAS domain S-box-containing protein
MECVQVWCAPAYDSPSLAVTAQNLRVSKNVGLAGRVWATGMPQGVPSLPVDTILPELGCSFALPVKVGAEVIGVMHFFGGRAEPAEADLVAMFEATGHQIGQFMHRERTQQSLRASEAAARKLSLVASHSLNAVIITDTNCRIEWVNDGFSNITGYSREDAEARRLDELLHRPETDRAVSEFMRERINHREGFTAELTNYRGSGEKYWVSLEVQPVFSTAHELTNFIAIATDITERKLSEVALIEANIQLNLALEGPAWHCGAGISRPA